MSLAWDSISYSLTFDDGSTVVRRARKQHHCSGGHDGSQRVYCDQPILPGEMYVEFYGESPAYQSGKRYHIDCAKQQGLIKSPDESAKDETRSK